MIIKMTKSKISTVAWSLLAAAALVAGCSAPQPALTSAVSRGAPGATATPTRARGPRPAAALDPAGPTSTPAIAPTPVMLATLPPPTPVPAPSATPAASAAAVGRSTGGAVSPGALSGVPQPAIPVSAPSLDPTKYPAPVLASPDDGAVFHVSQPLVHFTWTNTPSDLMRFGTLSECTSDSAHFRFAFETNQIVIHNLEGKQADIVGWMDTGQDYNLNLTTVPAGRYSWTVNVGVVCESYVIGQRNDLSSRHKSTLDRVYLGPVSPSSAPRTLSWIP